MTYTSEDNVFIFSSWVENPKRYFEGYCFIDNNLIVNNEGADGFESKTGRKIEPGEDGCYVLLRSMPDRTTQIGADFRGNKRLFYYSNQDEWAISNSLFALADHLRARGVSIALNRTTLATFFTNTLAFKQMMSYQTIFDPIKLAPSNCHFQISKQGLSIRHAKVRPLEDYHTSMRRYLEIWSSRFATLFSDERYSHVVDVSGGRDTRVSLAMVLYVDRLMGGSFRERVTFHTSGNVNSGARIDREIAYEIGSAFGLDVTAGQLSGNRSALSGPTPDGRAKFEKWQSLNLGVYQPILFTSASSPFCTRITGSGGEAIRVVYDYETPKKFVSKLAKRFKSTGFGCAEEFTQCLIAVIEEIADRNENRLPPLVYYFREFRSRLHAGGNPNAGKLDIQPLPSRDLYHCCDCTDAEKLRTSQLHYDLIGNLAPDLLHIKFDKLEKNPSRSNLHSIPDLGGIDTTAGQIFGGEDSPDLKQATGASNSWEIAASQIRSLNVPAWLGDQKWVSESIDKAILASQQGAPELDRDTIDIHRLLLCKGLQQRGFI